MQRQLLTRISPLTMGLCSVPAVGGLTAGKGSWVHPWGALAPLEARGRGLASDAAARAEAEPEAEGAGSEKQKKDKKPATSYLRFSMAERAKVVAENPGIKFGDIQKIVGERWRSMSEEEKKPYMDAYLKDKAIWEANHPPKK